MPTTSRIIFPQPDGRLSIDAPLSLRITPGETERDALLRHARRIVPAGVAFRIVAESDLPTDRAWRDAWTADFTTPDGTGERA
jgi:hypothetical protein